MKEISLLMTDKMKIDLQSIIGKKIIGFECNTLTKYNMTCSSIKLMIEDRNLMITNELRFAEQIEDEYSVLSVGKINNNDSLSIHPLTNYNIESKISDILIISDIIKATDGVKELFCISYDFGIVFVMTDEYLLIEKDLPMSEFLFVHQTKDYQTVLNPIEKGWSFSNNISSKFDRKIHSLRSGTEILD